MAMNKKEKEMVEGLREFAALRWPTEAEPERMPAPGFDEEVIGWDFNRHSGQVGRYLSKRSTTYRLLPGEIKPSVCGSQGGSALYRTEREAFIAMRWAACREMARRLRLIDMRIESFDG